MIQTEARDQVPELPPSLHSSSGLHGNTSVCFSHPHTRLLHLLQQHTPGEEGLLLWPSCTVRFTARFPALKPSSQNSDQSSKTSALHEQNLRFRQHQSVWHHFHQLKFNPLFYFTGLHTAVVLILLILRKKVRSIFHIWTQWSSVEVPVPSDRVGNTRQVFFNRNRLFDAR